MGAKAKENINDKIDAYVFIEAISEKASHKNQCRRYLKNRCINNAISVHSLGENILGYSQTRNRLHNSDKFVSEHSRFDKITAA